MGSLIVNIGYFIAAIVFIYSLKSMSHPSTARKGIHYAGIAMILAVVITIFHPAVTSHAFFTNIFLIVVAIGIGFVIAKRSALKVEMTNMPQMIAIYNGVGGGAAAIIGAIALLQVGMPDTNYDSRVLLLAALGGFIGAVSFTGSVVAWAKLDGRMNATIRFKNRNLINLFIFGFALLLAVLLASESEPHYFMLFLFFALTLALGILIAIPIGGADMPVIISLFNALTGIAVAFEGIALDNGGLIIAGTVVGAAGTLLTLLMAKAMNRSINNVLFSNFGEASSESTEIDGAMTETDAANAAMTMAYADRVIIVPGYGLAAAQAQHKVAELVKILEARDVDVRFAIHPVAGRMPGHMNVLLAESGIPYESIFDLDEINGEFKDTDVVLVIGANDVVNPVARTDKSSPIYGMPILNADEAKQVFVLKRGQGAGFSGIENHLFYLDNTDMVYGDAQKTLSEMITTLKSL